MLGTILYLGLHNYCGIENCTVINGIADMGGVFLLEYNNTLIAKNCIAKNIFTYL